MGVGGCTGVQRLSLQLRLMVCMMAMRMGGLMEWGLSLEEMLASLYSMARHSEGFCQS